MQLLGLFDELQDRLRPLRSHLFPRQVLLELHDDLLRGQVLNNNLPGPLSIEAPLPAHTCLQGMPLEKEPLGDLIGDLLVRDNLLDAVVMTALPATAVEWRVIVWPFNEMPDDPVGALRQLDPPLHLARPLSQSYLDLQPLPGQPAQMLLAATPRALVQAWIDVFHLAGAQLDRLAPAQSCQLAALQPLLSQAPAGQLIALLEPMSERVRLVLLHSGLPVFERILPQLEGDGLVKELMRCLAFYRRQDPTARELRLLITEPMQDQEALEQALGLEAELLSPDPYGSLVLRGLATAEARP